MFRKRVLLFVALLCLAVLTLLAGCGGRGAQPGVDDSARQLSGSITAIGSTAMQPLMEQAADQFMAQHPDARIVVQGGGSGTGLTQVAQGAADVGNSDIFAEEKAGIDVSQLADHRVCVAGIAIVANPAITVDNLTKQQLIDIFTGKTANWEKVGGPDQSVVLVNRPKASGTRGTFKRYALDGAEEAAGIEQDSSGTVYQIIKETPGAIGYLALSYLDDSLKVINLDGIAPTKENITTGKYPVWAYLHSYTKGNPGGVTGAFLAYLMSADVQQGIVPEFGYIPEVEMKIVRDAGGNVCSK